MCSVNPPFSAVDHVQLAMPPGEEDRARAFYAGVLGMTEVQKPPNLAARGGCWFASGGVQIHLGVEDGFRPSRKAHPALRCSDYDALIGMLRASGFDVSEDAAIPGTRRAYASDPFGNRLELIAERHAVFPGATFSVRRFAATDLPAIKTIDGETFPPEDRYGDDVYGRFGNDPSLTVLIAVTGGRELAGYVLLDTSLRPVRLRSLAVRAEFRRTGYGTALLYAALAGLNEDVDLFVDGDNAAAIGLYKKCGFQVTSNTGELPERTRMLRCSNSDIAG